MFLAHAPAGLLVAAALGPSSGPASRAVVACAVAGALLPDVDMLWFFLVDDGRVHHHRYWTHVPLFWAAVAPVLLAVAARVDGGRPLRAATALLLGIASHLALDTVVGDIQWLQPFSDRFVHLVEVPRRVDAHGGRAHWVWSFVLHWTFALELVIAALGIAVTRRWFSAAWSRSRSRSSSSG